MEGGKKKKRRGGRRRFPLGSFASCLQSIHRFFDSGNIRWAPGVCTTGTNSLNTISFALGTENRLFYLSSSADVRESSGSCERRVARVTTSEPQPPSRVKTYDWFQIICDIQHNSKAHHAKAVDWWLQHNIEDVNIRICGKQKRILERKEMKGSKRLCCFQPFM